MDGLPRLSPAMAAAPLDGCIETPCNIARLQCYYRTMLAGGINSCLGAPPQTTRGAAFTAPLALLSPDSPMNYLAEAVFGLLGVASLSRSPSTYCMPARYSWSIGPLEYTSSLWPW